jgi:hypothetical protein
LVLKIPTEQGVLTLHGNIFIAYTCETESYQAAEAFDLSAYMQQAILESKLTAPDQIEIPKNQATRSSTMSKDYKEVELVDGDKSKMARIGTRLDAK